MFTHSITHSYTDGGVSHARRHPACQEQLGLGVLLLLMDTSTLGQVEPEIEPPFNPLNPGSTFCFVDNLFMNHWATATPTNLLLIICVDLFLNGLFVTHQCIMHDLHKWSPPNIRRHLHWMQFIFKCVHFNYPNYLRQYLINILHHII